MTVVIRAEFRAPTSEWFELVDLTFYKVEAESEGKVSTAPGPWPGAVDWFFDDDKDACWFLLQYGGENVSEEWLPYLTTDDESDKVW